MREDGVNNYVTFFAVRQWTCGKGDSRVSAGSPTIAESSGRTVRDNPPIVLARTIAVGRPDHS